MAVFMSGSLQKNQRLGLNNTKKVINQIVQKVSEETAETIIEAVRGKKKLTIQESCDLLYHLIVMWSKLGINPNEIWNELDKRMKKKDKKK